MPTFAHTESGAAIDVQIDVSIAAYTKRFSSEFTSKWTIEQIPDGTMNGAVRVNGSWINPVSSAPAVVIRVMSGSDFVDLCISVFGVSRFGTVMRAARASLDDGVFGLMERYDARKAAGTFSRDTEIKLFFSSLVTAKIATQDESDAIAAAWPTA